MRNKSTLKYAMKGVDYIFHAAVLSRFPVARIFLNDNWLNEHPVIQLQEEPSISDKYGNFEKIVFSKWANNPVDKQFTAHYSRSGLEVHLGYRNAYMYVRGKELSDY